MAVDLAYRIEVQADQAKAELSATERAIVKTSQAAKDLDKSVSESEKRLNKSFAEVEKNAKKLEDQVERLGRTTEETNKKKGALSSTLMRYAGPAALGLAIKATAQYADRLEEMSVQTGLTIRTLQAFDHAAKLNGSNLEAVTRAAGIFQDRLAGGDKSVKRALDQLGISFDAIRSKSPDQQMYELARAVAAIEDPTKRAFVVTDLFGGAAKGLIPTFIALVEQGNKVPGMAEENVKAIGKLADVWERLKGIGTTVIGNLFAPLGPILEKVVGSVEWAVGKIGTHLQSLLGPIGLLRQMYQDLSYVGGTALPGMPNAPTMPTNTQNPFDDITNLLGKPEFFSYTGEIERQVNDSLREQARLQKERAQAAEEASKKAERAAREELKAWNELIAANRTLVSESQAAIGQDFNLFFNRGFDARGGILQYPGSYWGQTDIPVIPGVTDLGGVSGTMPGLQSGGNIASWVYGQRNRPSGQDYFNRQWMATYGDYSSFGNGATSAMNAFGTYSGAIEDIATGDTAVLRATNVRGRGNRAWRGAVAGAQEGGQYGGPYGAMGGAVVGLLIGLFRNPAFEDMLNRSAHRFGEEISEELSRTMADLDKSRKDWGREETEVYTIGAQMREIGVDDQNFDKMAARVRDIFVMVEQGKFTVEEARKALDESFGMLAEHVTKSKHLASEGFQELIALNRQFGIESEAVRQFVEQQTAVLGETVAAMAGPLMEQYGGLNAQIENTKLAIAGMVAAGREGSTEHTNAVTALQALQAKQAEGAAAAGEEFERLGLIAVASFNAAVEGGMSYLDAVEAMSPALDTLIQLQKDLGLTSENAALAELTAFRDRIRQNETLVIATEALGETMRALTSIGGLNTETLAAMEAQGLQTFQRLTDAGFTENQALMMMKDFIVNIIEAHDQLGTPIDENTQRLIDQAREAGVLSDVFKSDAEIMKEGFDQVTGAVGLLAQAFGVQLPRAVQDAIDRMNDIPREFDLDVNVNYNDPGFDPGGGSYTPNGGDYAVAGGYVGAHGIQYLATGGRVLGFRPRGSDTVPAMLTPGEGILSRRGMEALGRLNRGESVDSHDTITIHVSGADDPEAVADAVLRKLTQRRKYSRYRGGRAA